MSECMDHARLFHSKLDTRPSFTYRSRFSRNVGHFNFLIARQVYCEILMTRRQVVWFKRDLRVRDHVPLTTIFTDHFDDQEFNQIPPQGQNSLDHARLNLFPIGNM